MKATQQLIDEITRAFAKSIFPGNANIAHSTYGDEAALVAAHFKGQHNWQSLSSQFIDYDGALAFFTDEAFRFYLPAYLIADVREELALNFPVTSLCTPFTRAFGDQKLAQVFGGGTIRERYEVRFSIFSKSEVVVIVEYLRWKLAQDDFNADTIQHALETYWLARTE